MHASVRLFQCFSSSLSLRRKSVWSVKVLHKVETEVVSTRTLHTSTAPLFHTSTSSRTRCTARSWRSTSKRKRVTPQGMHSPSHSTAHRTRTSSSNDTGHTSTASALGYLESAQYVHRDLAMRSNPGIHRSMSAFDIPSSPALSSSPHRSSAPQRRPQSLLQLVQTEAIKEESSFPSPSVVSPTPSLLFPATPSREPLAQEVALSSFAGESSTSTGDPREEIPKKHDEVTKPEEALEREVLHLSPLPAKLQHSPRKPVVAASPRLAFAGPPPQECSLGAINASTLSDTALLTGQRATTTTAVGFRVWEKATETQTGVTPPVLETQRGEVSVWTAATREGERTEPPHNAQSLLTKQQTTLRQWFTDAHEGHNVVHLRKEKSLYRAECEAYALAHKNPKAPRGTQPSRTVPVELAPVVALRTYAMLQEQEHRRNAPKKQQHGSRPGCAVSSARIVSSPPHAQLAEAAIPSLSQLTEALLLQQHARQHQLVQANSKIWLRCLRCFHFFEAKPKKLLTARAVQLRWTEEEKEWERMRRRYQCRPAPKRSNAPLAGGGSSSPRALRASGRWESLPALRGTRRQAEQRRRAQQRVDEPEDGCPWCGSYKVQWALEYVHHRTHMNA